MPIPISYMGTKKQLAPMVAELTQDAVEGPFLDLFSGMCAVGAAISPRRQVWSNDLQAFAHSVAEAHFCFRSPPPSRADVTSAFRGALASVREEKYRASAHRLKEEHDALASGDGVVLQNVYAEWSAEDLEAGGPEFGTFERNFAGSYFGLAQSIEIDAIRQLLDEAKAKRRISKETHNWLLLALAVAIGQCATVTGHFAQPLTPKKQNFRRFVHQREKAIADHWFKAIEGLTPIGDEHWRRGNVAFRTEACDLLTQLSKANRERPAVVYADPPYTNDHYSRYYHVYETLVLYDRPAARGKGRYRDDRVASRFSLKAEVEGALKDLFRKTAEIGATLILSYPTNGLLERSRENIPEMMREAVGVVPEVWEVEHRHSTMGGSKGAGKTDVVEVLYRVRAV